MSEKQSSLLADVFALFGQPNRLNILLALGSSHACVCQLEALLGQRQAYISQQLMLLRDSGLVKTTRSGRHIFYSLKDSRWLEMIHQAAALLQVDLPEYELPQIEGCTFDADNKELL